MHSSSEYFLLIEVNEREIMTIIHKLNYIISINEYDTNGYGYRTIIDVKCDFIDKNNIKDDNHYKLKKVCIIFRTLSIFQDAIFSHPFLVNKYLLLFRLNVEFLNIKSHFDLF